MVKLTIELDPDINKELEHFKIDNNCKNKREAASLIIERHLTHLKARRGRSGE